MADEELKIEEGGKKKSKLMLIIIVVVLLAGGAGAYFFLFMGDEVTVVEGEAGAVQNDAVESAAPAEGQALYVAMPRPFTFNAPGVARERIVQIEVQLMVRGIANEELAKRHIPMIEGTLLQVFSASNADDLVTDVGKVELKERATSQVRQVMRELEKSTVVEQVLFTGFVIQ
ncbi:flagellar basal body-associated protein FliL [Brumicola nitratireducens]|uniref:Flagellar protein FliL n=1 Tax=Glaciecola nitratireducens (strain JCM 12485 / KCTC 12276 / FR1064) TaxID=1085623 RepID=G4QLW6_GLANF|nr:flagellar basal body-associated protein FliL [Glaciecola nitratireducens]AEP30456.1 flagellar basal body-associated protein FliL [Glaciecola nitratireducens FR1064]